MKDQSNSYKESNMCFYFRIVIGFFVCSQLAFSYSGSQQTVSQLNQKVNSAIGGKERSFC